MTELFEIAAYVMIGVGIGMWLGGLMEAHKWREKAHNPYGINRIISKKRMYVVHLEENHDKS